MLRAELKHIGEERLIELKEEQPEKRSLQLDEECRVSGLVSEILIEGFDTSEIITGKDIKEFRFSSPLHHNITSMIDSVLYMGEQEEDYPIAGEAIKDPETGKSTIGIFKPKLEDIKESYELLKTIPPITNKEREVLKTVFRDKLAKEMKITIVHEEAEIYYREKMSSKRQKEWKSIWEEHKNQGKEFITKYASFNKIECFGDYAGIFEITPQKVFNNNKKMYQFLYELYLSLKNEIKNKN